MPAPTDLLQPLPGPNAGGANLGYDPLYAKLKEARREDDAAPQGEWTRPRKMADWPQVMKLASDALATKSKDLQIAAWLTEALAHQDGVAGLNAGLDLLRGLVERHWDHLYPELEDGDTGLRAAPLDWVGRYLHPAIRSVPLNKTGHDFFKYREARATGYEAGAAGDQKKLAARQAGIAEGRLAGERRRCRRADRQCGPVPATRRPEEPRALPHPARLSLGRVAGPRRGRGPEAVHGTSHPGADALEEPVARRQVDRATGGRRGCDGDPARPRLARPATLRADRLWPAGHRVRPGGDRAPHGPGRVAARRARSPRPAADGRHADGQCRNPGVAPKRRTRRRGGASGGRGRGAAHGSRCHASQPWASVRPRRG